MPNTSKSLNFFELVYEAVAQVPQGKVTTYSAIAKYLGNPRASRAVGWAMRQCPYPNSRVPCHRVIKADGSVGGWSSEDGIKTKIELLKKEGIKVKQERVDLSNYEFTNFRV